MKRASENAHSMPTSAELARLARQRAGLSVRALAGLAGVPASTVSRIENERVDPSVGTLRKILRAAGQDLGMRELLPDLAELSSAWVGDPRVGHPDWTRIRAWLDAAVLAPLEDVVAAVRRAPIPSGHLVLDNVLAGVAEKIADDAGRAHEPWTVGVAPLAREWSAPATPRMLAAWRSQTPRQLTRRDVTVDAETLWRHGADGA